MVRIFYLSILLLFVFPEQSRAIVCREPQIAGYSEALHRGKSYLPPNTSDVSKLAVYIERDPNGTFYFQSNYIVNGFDNPTKIGGEHITDIDLALMNIVYTAYPSPSEEQRLHKLMLDEVSFYVNKDIFESDGTTALDFKGRTHVIIVDPISKTSTGGLIINGEHPPPFGAERIAGCCVNGRPPGDKARAGAAQAGSSAS